MHSLCLHAQGASLFGLQPCPTARSPTILTEAVWCSTLRWRDVMTTRWGRCLWTKSSYRRASSLHHWVGSCMVLTSGPLTPMNGRGQRCRLLVVMVLVVAPVRVLVLVLAIIAGHHSHASVRAYVRVCL